jgi:asparagine synthase (glutamine-hydrolysing)
MLAAFFGEGLSDTDSPWYSHAIRWRNNRRTTRFLENSAGDSRSSLPADFNQWGPLSKAQYVEISIFLSQYLLSSQGDRMGMAHSVEGRFPFLDVRLVEFCNQLPERMKLRGLTEKYLLKKTAQPWLPDIIRTRPKRPYRAPIHRSFFNEKTPDYVRQLLSAEAIRGSGLFKAGAVEQLVRKIDAGAAVGETDDMALAGILSTQLVHHRFISNFRRAESLTNIDRVKTVRLNHLIQRKTECASPNLR